MELVLKEGFVERIQRKTFAPLEREGILVQLLAGEHLFKKRFAIGDHHFYSLLKAREYLRSEQHIGIVRLLCLVRTAVATGEEKHLLLPQEQFQVIEQISRLLLVITHEKQCAPRLLKNIREDKALSRAYKLPYIAGCFCLNIL